MEELRRMSGHRIEKAPTREQKQGKKGAVLAGVIAAVLLCGYLGLCAWVGGRNVIMPHVGISGLDVSGMTRDQAADALKNALAEESGDPITLNISCEGWSGQLSAADLAVDQEATVQAAIGSVPLSLGLPCGDMVLSTAVLGILITAPLGAFAIDWGAPRLLTQEKEPS